MKFVDLFAGLGGFHLALRRLGHECVFACEIDKELQSVYEKNFGIRPSGDIADVTPYQIPPHDILCAGFPCQSFSKAGRQFGLEDPKSGGLVLEVLKVVRYHRPRFFVLENVANFERHDSGQTWRTVKGLFEAEGYDLRLRVLSPHRFGIPQIRERVYIAASRRSLAGFRWPEPPALNPALSIRTILDESPEEAKLIPPGVQSCINVWQQFLDRFPPSKKLPSFPIWAMEFGATYPYEDATPHSTPIEELRNYRGSFGECLGTHGEDLFLALPSHARTAEARFPKWKIDFIRQNRELYESHRAWIDEWKPLIGGFPSSFQKLEWNCQGEERVLKRFVLQMRASGVRVKRPTTSPSLVAMTATQVPIIAWENRYITPNESKRLQSMHELEHLPSHATRAYQAIGNAVNVDVAELVMRSLLHC